MKRSKFTYGHLDKVLRSLGYSCRVDGDDPPARIYEHKGSGSIILLPAYPLKQRAYEIHILTTRMELDNFGVADPSDFAAELQKVG